MSQQMNNGAEKNVAEDSAAIVDKEAVSITTFILSLFIYYIDLSLFHF